MSNQNMLKKELLAPAGDIEAGYAALYYGADAVYLGLQQFSARASATNFGEKDLDEFVAYAHSLKRKVFVAINTLIQEKELENLLKSLDLCVKYNVDAIIIQDLGVAKIIREYYPQLEMHASTQMAVHNKEGALALKNMGFSRVVLARELTLPEIREIAAIPDLETEAFIHGALCYSYSGICLFSSLETGKSANRGKCLYPCRASFDGCCGKKHYFSMKDMALEEDVLKMPVTSLKIEGRKKSSLYVAAVTDYYRRILDGKGADKKRAENIRQIFSRPWTRFHFNGKNKDVIDRDFVGHRGLKIGKVDRFDKNHVFFKTNHKIARFDGLQFDVLGDEKPFGFSLKSLKVGGKNVFEAKSGETVEVLLPPNAPKLEKGVDVYLASATDVKGAYPYQKPKPGEYRRRYDLDVCVCIQEDRVRAQALEKCFEIEGNFDKAKNISKIQETIRSVFEKTGDTNFCLKNLYIENPLEFFVPVSVLNELRRGLYRQIEFEDVARNISFDEKSIRKISTPQWAIKTDNIENLSLIDINSVAEIVFLLSPDTDIEKLFLLPKNKLRISLPAVCRHPKLFEENISKLLSHGYKKWEVGNYWGLSVLPKEGIDLSFDASLYVMNSQAVAMAQMNGASRVTFALEDSLSNINDLSVKSVLPLSMIVYQDVPLFTSADCIRENSCKDCPRGEKWFQLQRDGVNYSVLSKDCQIMLFDDKPFCVAKEAASVKADFYRADFCYKKYSPQQVQSIFSRLQKFEDIELCIKGNINRPNLL